MWSWTAIDPESKLIVSYLVGDPDAETAYLFVVDIAERVKHRIQITTDGLKAYLVAIEDNFGSDVDYGILHKVYGPTVSEGRYSPAVCLNCEAKAAIGNPDASKISTSYVERQSLTMRMRRFTRLTNAFSKQIENHEYAVALHFFHYNFVRHHQTLRMSPALKAGVTNHMWTMRELVEMIDQYSEEKV